MVEVPNFPGEDQPTVLSYARTCQKALSVWLAVSSLASQSSTVLYGNKARKVMGSLEAYLQRHGGVAAAYAASPLSSGRGRASATMVATSAACCSRL